MMLKISKSNIKPKIKNGNNKKEKYVLNIAEDLLKMPNDTFYKIDISSFSGEYYNKIYQEALEVEQGKRKLKNIKPITVDIEGKDNVDKFFESKTKGTKEKKDKKEMSGRKGSMTTRSKIKEKLDLKIKIDKKEKDEKKDDSYQTPNKGNKYQKIIKLNKKLKYDSPVNNKSKAIVFNKEDYVTPVKNRASLLFDSYGRMRERNNDIDSTNYSTPEKNRSNSLRNKIILLRKREDKPRISSEGKNTEIKRHKFEPLEIIFEENSRIKKVISPEINKKRNSSSKFNRILNNLYNINTNTNTNNDFNHNQNTIISKEVKTEDKNNKYEKSLSSIFNEIKKKQRKKYYFSLLQKKINYLKQIKSNNKFNQNTNFIQTNNIFNTNTENIIHNENKNDINTNNNNYKTYDDSRKKHHNSKGFRNNNNDHKINKIRIEFKYDSNYGDNIGILGSTDQLGNWCQDKILYLKWNYGNIWSNSIDVDNYNLENFEFKFIISHDGTIYWEKGYNYLVDFEALIDEIKHYKKGRFNKYEYIYKKDSSELILKCKWNGWEWDINNDSEKS